MVVNFTNLFAIWMIFTVIENSKRFFTSCTVQCHVFLNRSNESDPNTMNFAWAPYWNVVVARTMLRSMWSGECVMNSVEDWIPSVVYGTYFQVSFPQINEWNVTTTNINNLIIIVTNMIKTIKIQCSFYARGCLRRKHNYGPFNKNDLFVRVCVCTCWESQSNQCVYSWPK